MQKSFTEEIKKNKSFRLNAKNLFLTYPQAPLEWTCEVVLTFLQKKLVGISNYIVALENHAGDGIHFHCLLCLPSKVNFKSPNCLDLDGHHGHYLGAKDVGDVARYCMKENKFISDFTNDQLEMFKKGLNANQAKNVALFKKACEKGVHTLLEDGDVKITQFDLAFRGMNAYKLIKTVDEREDLDARLPNSWGIDMNVNLDRKQCHLWLYSHSPNRGKTTFLLSIKKKYRAEFWNYHSDFQDQVTTKTEVIMMDELRGYRIKASILNQVCDGTYCYNHKGMKPVELEAEKPLVIVCSNLSINECYKEEYHPLLHARFLEYDLE